MENIREGKVGEEIEGHPELSEMIRIIQFGSPLVVARGGDEYLIITAGNTVAHYKFTKKDGGYFMEKSR